ncbi:hypothetical protein C3L29_012635 [Pseudomonas sp. MWU12-2534b]|nr:hypothetical protein C3L29_012635 [Pseudomonas sp. MWU12-2534b]
MRAIRLRRERDNAGGVVDGIGAFQPQQHQAKVVRQSTRGRASRNSFIPAHTIEKGAGNL